MKLKHLEMALLMVAGTCGYASLYRPAASLVGVAALLALAALRFGWRHRMGLQKKMLELETKMAEVDVLKKVVASYVRRTANLERAYDTRPPQDET
jgi:uncharacterized membrane protein YqjE